MIKKKCSKCNVEKDHSCFFSDSKAKDGLYSSCKPCKNNSGDRIQRLEYQKEYKDKNKDKIKQFYENNKGAKLDYEKKYYEQNKDNVLLSCKKYREENKDKINLAYKNRYNNDILFKIRVLLRARLYHAIKDNQKTGSAVSDLGCSVEEFKIYLESKFESWMTWENHGKYIKDIKTWQIDHIKALANFDLSKKEELLNACHYTNLQPKLSEDNLKKSDKYE
jgi:hypothetical protein